MIIRVCPVCFREFTIERGSQKYCSHCLKHNIEEVRLYQRNMKNLKKLKKKQADGCQAKLIQDAAEIEAYNKKHGTHLSYGQYKTLKLFGMLKE